MLREITIENVAVIEKATVRFDVGFTALTGETGAGKSIMIDSINAILGNRTSRDIVRSGAAKAGIWAAFEEVPAAVLAQLEAAGYTCDGELLLQREITADGKSTCRVNGAPATATILRDICGRLVNIHGQHDNQSLMDPSRHIGLLDAYAGNAALRGEYSGAFSRLKELKSEKALLSMNEAEKGRKIDLLRYELAEIEGAALEENEEERLNEQREMVLNAQTIIEGLNATYYALNGGDEGTGAATLLSAAANGMGQAAGFAPEFAEFAERLNEMYYTAGEMASEVQSRISDFEFDGHSLDTLEARLDLIYRLKQKYGPALADVIDYGEKAKKELESITFSAERLEEIEKQLYVVQSEVEALAQRLTESRLAAFDRLNEEITGTLAFLNMPGITLALARKQGEPGPKGWDELEFTISTNPGEAPKPMAKIASGGELARIMLAIKSALADKDDVPTIIYDEIDTGISGMAAGRIGQVLRKTAGQRQVVCVTHTAQIAAYANRHLQIEKQVEGGRTYTHITELDEAGRVEELARITSGDKVTDLARANAEEMLQLARGH